MSRKALIPCPKPSLDRFMLKIQVDYPTREQEMTIAKRASTAYSFAITKVLTVEEILAMQELVRKMPVGDHVYEFAVDLVRKSRPERGKGAGYIDQMVAWGAGPRAAIFLLLDTQKPAPFCKAVIIPPPMTLSPWPCRSCAIASSSVV